MNLAEIIIKTGEMRDLFVDGGVKLYEPLLRIQCVAHDLGSNMDISLVATTIIDYAQELRCEMVVERELKYEAYEDWSPSGCWPIKFDIAGFKAEAGLFKDINNGLPFACARTKVLDRSGTGAELTLMSQYTATSHKSHERAARELLRHEMAESFYVAGGVRLVDPHVSTVTLCKVAKALEEIYR